MWAADTPHCSIKADVPYRILDIYGEAARDGSNKYLVQLRDPVARVISSWTSKFDRESWLDRLGTAVITLCGY